MLNLICQGEGLTPNKAGYQTAHCREQKLAFEIYTYHSELSTPPQLPRITSAPSSTTMALALWASLKKAATPLLFLGLAVIVWERSSVQFTSCEGGGRGGEVGVRGTHLHQPHPSTLSTKQNLVCATALLTLFETEKITCHPYQHTLHFYQPHLHPH